MFYGRTTNNKINKLHERALRLVYDDRVSAFEELLEKTIRLLFITIIYRHCIELYKILVDSLKQYLVICLKEKMLVIICAHSLTLLFCKLKLFIKGQFHFDTLDLLYGV